MFFSKLFDKTQGLLLIVAGISFVFNIVAIVGIVLGVICMVVTLAFL